MLNLIMFVLQGWIFVEFSSRQTKTVFSVQGTTQNSNEKTTKHGLYLSPDSSPYMGLEFREYTKIEPN